MSNDNNNKYIESAGIGAGTGALAYMPLDLAITKRMVKKNIKNTPVAKGAEEFAKKVMMPEITRNAIFKSVAESGGKKALIASIATGLATGGAYLGLRNKYPDWHPKQDVSNLGYLLDHKINTYNAGRKLDVGRGQLLMHDASKFTPKEWVAYRDYFHSGNKSREAREKFLNARKTSHYIHNPHHPAHFGIERGQSKAAMPMKYKLEMIADWYGAAKAQGRIPRDLSFVDWYTKNRRSGRLAMDEDVLVEVDKKLGIEKSAGVIARYIIKKLKEYEEQQQKSKILPQRVSKI